MNETCLMKRRGVFAVIMMLAPAACVSPATEVEAPETSFVQVDGYRVEEALPPCTVPNIDRYNILTFQPLSEDRFSLVPFDSQSLAGQLARGRGLTKLSGPELKALGVSAPAAGELYLAQVCVRSVAQNAEFFAETVFESRTEFTLDPEARHLHSTTFRIVLKDREVKGVYFIVAVPHRVEKYTSGVTGGV